MTLFYSKAYRGGRVLHNLTHQWWSLLVIDKGGVLVLRNKPVKQDFCMLIDVKQDNIHDDNSFEYV